MKAVAVTAWMGMTIRNIFYSQTLEELTRRFDLTVVSYYPNELTASLSDSKSGTKFTKLRVPRWRLPNIQNRLTRLLYEWNLHAFYRRHNIQTIETWLRPKREKNWCKFYFHKFVGGGIALCLRKNSENRDFLRDLTYLVPLQKDLRSVNALLVFSINIHKDQQLIYTFRKLGTPVIALVHSWDNLTSKGLFSALPDRLLVWNDIMRQEAVNFHDIPFEAVDVVGVPQYEKYRELAPMTNEKEFRERLKISFDAVIITYAASAESMFPDEERFVDELLDEIMSGKYGEAVLVLRLHPPDVRKERYCKKYQNKKLPIRLDFPDSAFTAFNTWSIGDESSVREFVELMQYSDVIINLSSTIALDAVLFDTPVICLNFNYLPDTAWNTASMHHRCQHFRPVVESDAVDFPSDMEELSSSIDSAIKNPFKKTMERRQLVTCMMPELPTSQLIADSVERAIRESKG